MIFIGTVTVFLLVCIIALSQITNSDAKVGDGGRYVGYGGNRDTAGQHSCDGNY